MRSGDEQPAPSAIPADEAPLWKRIGWMAAIWAMSVATLGVVAYFIRWWIAP